MAIAVPYASFDNVQIDEKNVWVLTYSSDGSFYRVKSIRQNLDKLFMKSVINIDYPGNMVGNIRVMMMLLLMHNDAY